MVKKLISEAVTELIYGRIAFISKIKFLVKHILENNASPATFAYRFFNFST